MFSISRSVEEFVTSVLCCIINFRCWVIEPFIENSAKSVKFCTLLCLEMSALGSSPHFAAWGAATAARTGGGFGGNMTVVDKVLPDMLHLVDPHWYQFPPMNPLWHAILGFMIGVLGFVSVIGNGMVIYIFSSTKTLRTASNLLVVNLAFSDFLMMLTMSPPMVINCFYETWVLGKWELSSVAEKASINYSKQKGTFLKI